MTALIPASAAVALALALTAHANAAPDLDAMTAALQQARQSYDLHAAESARDAIREWNRATPVEQSNLLLADASLLVAELNRIAFEETKETDQRQRRDLGRAIDLAAQEGLTALEPVRPSSEVYRMRADLVGTMIRSEFQAQKYRKRMDEAIAKALELDPKNPKAWVTAAKPYLFAPENHGKDLTKAIEVLGKALALDPKLETALLLRAYANDQQGHPDQAQADWKTALTNNPSCKPAKEKLAPTPQSAKPN